CAMTTDPTYWYFDVW
nr:immunoglobulin heavy chain junction region [Mus musculus]NSM08246.1 immunoglobulin heavy chain junction region [Mus musculus]NSM08822.1 immunoglobulin heavy chain junction region [Mus musculus]NSM09013.1 immunoglobulin heavy chain junction region [Mus musculus]